MSNNINAMMQNKQDSTQHDGLEIAYDIVFILNANSKGWILDKICKIVDRYSDLNCFFLYSERNDQLTTPLPKARAYFFAHFAIAFWTMVKYPMVFGGSIFAYFTHFDKTKGISKEELSEFLNLCDHVFVMNSSHRRALVSLGVNAETVTAVIGGADPDIFPRHVRSGNVVGFVGAYYERKQPEKMISLMRSMPDVQFILLAPGPGDVENLGMLWRNWPEFSNLLALPNVRYIEAPYEDYPRYFAEMDVYVSLSSQEGGPIPVIEAMMSNTIALATNTGFAEDVLTGDLAKYIIDVDAPVEIIAQKVRMALSDQETDIRELALHISWQSVGEGILDIIRPTLALDRMEPLVTEGSTTSFGIGSPGRYLLTQNWSLESGYAALANESGCLTFRLREAQAGHYRVSIRLNFPAAQSTETVDQDVWHIGLKLNDRQVYAREISPSGGTLVETWIHLSEKEAAGQLSLSLSLVELSPTPAAKPRLELHDMTWTRLDLRSPSSVYDFTQTGGHQGLLGIGWHSLEPAGCWSRAPSATFAVFPPQGDGHAMISPVLTGRIIGASEDDGNETSFMVYAGHQVIRHLVVHRDDGISDIVLPPIEAPSHPCEPLVITVARRRVFRPVDLNPAFGDQRALGFLLRRVSFVRTG